ncbi:MAG: hypothetical protein Q8L48_14110 [Archangium sp.]|nr:hypothetical protein [Archangium sp.]
MGRLVVVVMGLTGALGCVERCVAGESNACACTDGRSGQQVCGDLGTFQACSCTSKPDAGPGTDGGTVCSTTNPLSVELNQPLRLAVGAGVTVRASSEATRFRWTLVGEPVDAGLVESLPVASLQFDRPGSWWLEVDVSRQQNGNCQEGHGRGGLLTVVPTTTLPLVVVDVACCDVEGHAYVVSDGPPTLWRLDGDQVSAPTPLARRPKRLALSNDGSMLFVGQDAFVSTYRVPSMALQWELPINGVVSGLTGDTQYAWLFTNADATRLELASGTLNAQTTFNLWSSGTITGAVTLPDGSLVLDESGYLRRVMVTSGVLSRPLSTEAQSCGNLWAWPGRREFYVGCRDTFEAAPDGGLSYTGVFDEGPDRVRALGRSGDGRLAVVSGFEPNRNVSRFRFISPETFQTLETRDIGLWSSPENTHLLPRWLVPHADGGVSALTPVPDLGLTWVEYFP